MLRRTALAQLKHRPAGVPTEVGSNRLLPPKVHEKATEAFRAPVFPGKRVVHNWRFFIKAGKAATGPPVGQEFSKLGLKAMDFAKAFNDRTKPVFKDDVDLICRVQVFHDKTYAWRVEPPPTAWLIMRAVRRKRRETGPVGDRGAYCCYITLEMAYEIAKIKQIDWSRPEYPPIETRVRRVVGQCRRMGIAVLGVDTHNSPVKGQTAAEYEKQSAAYRKEQWAQWLELKDKELKAAPLIERLHRPNLNPLSEEQLEEGLKDPRLFDALYKATQPKSRYLQQLKHQREVAEKMLRGKSWLKDDVTAEEAKALFLNWRLPEAERLRQLKGIHAEEDDVAWSRDGPKQQPAK